MKTRIHFILSLLLLTGSLEAAPLRVFIRAGVKTHGPGQHDHPRFLGEWTKLLTERGAQVEGAMEFPTAPQLETADVLIMYAANAGTIPAEQRVYLDKFLKRGGGMVVIHDAVVGNDPNWFKTIIGGAWENGKAKWLEGKLAFYFMDHEHPITRGASNFDLEDEIYYELNMMPEAHILAAAYTPNTPNTPKGNSLRGRHPSVYDIQPQMWTYEKDNHRAFVSILGHQHKTFNLPHHRAVLLRGIAWAGKRSNVDELCSQEELASLRYPEGGPTAPEKAAAKLELHPDFTMSLVAAEPLINKAMSLDWDPQGRLWVAETPEYPGGRRERSPNAQAEPWKDSGYRVRPPTAQRPAIDRISILTDTNGDGRMDQKQIFYEGLELVTSFVFHKDGVIVTQAPDILWLRDTNGDGKADKVEKLYTGLGTRDTHAVINNARWGFDGWIYATHGYSSGVVTSPDGKKNFGNINSGVVRFKPDGSAFEQYSAKGGNTWGLDISWDNEVFYTQPTSGDLLNHVVVPEYVLAKGRVGSTPSYKPLIQRRKSLPLMTSDMQAYVQIDQVGMFTASAGCAIYDSGAWPKEYHYSYFTTEPTINIVHHEVVKPDSLTYTADKVREPEFIGGRDLWFRPIETRIGPEGALYLLDFYNQAVIHNDTRGPEHNTVNAAVRPDRDHYFGRIWRVDHKQSKKIAVPNLAKASPAELVKALDHPNRAVRMNAQRLLSEREKHDVSPQLKKLAADKNAQAYARIHALWTLHHIGDLDQDTLVAAVRDGSSAVRNNALSLAQEPPTSIRGPERKLQEAMLEQLKGNDARAKLKALIAMSSFIVEPHTAAALVAAYPTLNDPWLESAAIAVANNTPVVVMEAVLKSGDQRLAGLAAQLTRKVADAEDAALALELAKVISQGPATANALKITALETLVRALRSSVVPDWNDDVRTVLQRLVSSGDVGAAALPLVARWDTRKQMEDAVASMLADLQKKLTDAAQPDAQRARLVNTLLAVRNLNKDILPTVAKILGTGSAELQTQVVEALGNVADKAAGAELIAAYPRLAGEVQTAAFNQLLKRADWSLALLDALKASKINANDFGPARLHRLRTHPDAGVARAANSLIDELRGPEAKEKNALIAKFTPLVTQPGNVVKGKELFLANCATCHQLGNDGKEVGPALNGMGAHGPAELLVHILDPNRALEMNYAAINITTRDGESYDGILARENPNVVAIRNAAGEMEIKKSDIKRRQPTGRSLMPEGFESLGGDALRDILAYMCAGDQKYRFIDLAGAATTDSRRGMYNNPNSDGERLKFVKFGIVNVEGVPFNIIDPARAPGGRNVMVLKGGAGYAKNQAPQKVEAKVGFAASKLHFLGAVGGWAHPLGGGPVPVLKVTAHYAGGQTEEIVMHNGNEFADYIRVIDVPGSRLTQGLVSENQLRWCTKPLKGTGVIEKLTFESYNNGVAPTMVAVTAELPGGTTAAAGGNGPAAAPAPVAPKKGPPPLPPLRKAESIVWGKGKRVLLVGGGSAHDYRRWFDLADVATLKAAGMSANYTESPEDVVREIKNLDALVLSINHPDFSTPELRKALFEYVDAGKGLILLHPGVWYNFRDWPEYNRVLAGGGSRGHDRLGEFEVKVTGASHPLMKGVPASFTITDELYYFEPDAQGTAIEILATAHSNQKNKTYPQVFIVKHPKTRIAAITLGHDGRAHDHPAYKVLLINAINWVSGK
ncbi:MAG: PVC-type heme-binding CxxCH protein [Verrucomicrobiota bacterium]